MSIEIKGQKAIDQAITALSERTQIELFGNKFVVTEVSTRRRAVSDCITAEVELMCTTAHRELLGVKDE